MHHSEWSPKPFFRHLSPTALIELCAWASDLRPEGPGKPWEQLYRAWARLEPDVRMKLESSLLPVNDLSVPEARPRLTELAAAVWPRGQLAEDSRSWSSQDLALRLFLASPGAFQQLHQGWVVDSLQHMKEYAGRYPLRPKPSARAKAELKEALRAYLQRTAFGPRCHVEDFANEEKFALFVFLEDELKPTDKFTESEDLESVWEREVVRLAAVFDYETSVLSVKAAHREEREQLRDLFAEHVMQDALYFIDAYSAPRYAFGRIADPRFHFTPIAGSEVVAVTVQKLVVHPADGDVRRVTLEFKGTPTLEQVRAGLQAHGLRVPGDTIDGVHLRFVFEGTGRSRTRTVSLFNPNSTNLSDTPRDRIIRRHLKAWGFDANSRRQAVVTGPLQAAAH